MIQFSRILWILGLLLLICVNSVWSDNTYIYNIDDFGAIGDGKTNSTEAIQKGIDTCSEQGGGTVRVPPGKYLTGTLFLKSYVNLELAQNAIILGSQKLEDYRASSPDDSEAEGSGPRYHIYAENAEHISITGLGTIDSQGEIFWRGLQRPFKRPSGQIRFEKCQNVTVKGITLTDSPNWTMTIMGCNWVWVDGIRIINFMEAFNTDGINPCSSTNVFISNCYIETGDDAICPKAYKEYGPVENLVVTNCVLITDDTAIKMGTRSSEAIRQCVFNNIVICRSKYGIGFYMKDGGIYEDIQFSNINIETLREDRSNANNYSLYFDIEPRDENTPVGRIRNVILRDIIINTYSGNCLIQGRSDSWIKDLHMENVRMRVHMRSDMSRRTKPRGTRTLTQRAPNDYANIPSHFSLGYIDGLVMRDIVIRDDSDSEMFERHSIWGENIKDMVLTNLDVQQKIGPKNLSTVYLNQTKDVIIENCRNVPQTVPFLEVNGEKTRSIRVKNAETSKMVTPFKIPKTIKKQVVIE